MKVLVDMNLSPAWIDFLVNSGFQAVHWSGIGRGDEPDADVMRWAAEHVHIVLTADLDFGAILAATGRRQPSVIQLRADVLTPAAAGEAVLSAIQDARGCAYCHLTSHSGLQPGWSEAKSGIRLLQRPL